MALIRKWRIALCGGGLGLLIAIFALCAWSDSSARAAARMPETTPAADSKHFRVIAIAEHGGIHKPFVDAAKIWLDKLAKDKDFSVDYIEDTSKIDDAFLAKYKLFIQLNYPPYGWTDTASAAFVKYIEQGKGGWIGFHHATLLGEFDGFQMWPWFHDFMGGIRFKDYIATFVTGTVTVEAPDHPVMRGVPSPFVIKDEEWYTYDKSPRSNEHMKARNVYIFMGHRPEHFGNPAFTKIFTNAIFWTAGEEPR